MHATLAFTPAHPRRASFIDALAAVWITLLGLLSQEDGPADY
jgi:hypothetical protein